MSIRVLVCFAFVLGFSIYAWRNWFVSLCAVLLLLAVLEHPDMPKNIAGIQGLNAWNILILNVVLAWAVNRKAQGLVWDMPGKLKAAFVGFLLVVFLSSVRMAINPTRLIDITGGTIFAEYFVNTFKWLLPCFLMYDGCRTRARVMWALGCVLLLYFLLAVQVVHRMPLRYAASAGALEKRAAKIVTRETGYHRVDMSMMLAGAGWATLSTLGLCRTRTQKFGVIGAAGMVMLGQALTGGRAGYVTWGIIGLSVGVVRYRKLLIVIPIAILVVLAALPGVAERMLTGFGGEKGMVATEASSYEITSGRTTAWPFVINEIGKSPLVGYGRLAMVRTGVAAFLMDELGEVFNHPHNAYLEMLLDSGCLGFMVGMPIFALALWNSFRLFRNRNDSLVSAAGGVAFCLLLALLVAGLGAQSFYPREGVVGMWAAMGIVLRLSSDLGRSGSSRPPPQPQRSEIPLFTP